MIVFFSLPLGPQTLTVDTFLKSFSTLDAIFRGTAAVICGTIYYILNPRSYFLGDTHKQITDNIKRRLLEPCLGDSQVAAAAVSLQRGRLLLDIFYQFVDNDRSLTER